MDNHTKQEMSNKKPPKKGEKLVIIGDSFVGKTSIINCLITGNITETKPTIGSQHHKYSFTNENNIEINLDIWDTAGQERFRSVIPMYYKGAKSIIVVFDITNRETFEGAKKWIEEIEQNNKNSLIFLVANKIDLIANRSVPQEIINEYTNYKKIDYLECSAKDNLNIENIFHIVGNKIPLEKDDKYTKNNNINKNLSDVNIENNQNRSSCC